MEEGMKEAWNLIKAVFPVLNEQKLLPFKETSSDEFYSAVNIIKTFKATETVQYLIITHIEKFAREEIAVRFWSSFHKPHSDREGFQNFLQAVNVLYNYFMHLSNIMAKVDLMRKYNDYQNPIYESNAVDALKLIIRASLLSQLPLDHKFTSETFYKVALQMEEQKSDSFPLDQSCEVCLVDKSDCNCMLSFYETNRKLVELGLLEPLVGQVLTDLIYSYIESHIQKICKDSYDTSYIEHLEKWLDSVVITWLNKIYCCNPRVMSDGINKFIKKLTNFLYETYTKVRINQLFNIIIEFPDSLAALEDLRYTLSKTDLRQLLTKKLQSAMERRLLHPGVSTPDILTAYIAAIRTMRVLDPTGLLLEIVTQPVHQYLRSREDTIKCVVSSLTDESSYDLDEELARSEAIQVDENIPMEDENEDWQNWMPDPVDADPKKPASIRRTSDILSMLVNVYGSKELFVNEYRTILADRLLSQFTCDTEKEIRYLELLKVRFGESQLHYCEVMLKDIQDSKRINQHIKQDCSYTETTPMSAVIVSAQFWPAFKEEKLQLHPALVEQLNAYTKAFETLKGSRTLCWKNHLGVVELEIELGDRTLNLNVTPVQATILAHFQDKNEWGLEELSKVMQVPPTLLKKKISFWQSHGVIGEKNNTFYLVEDQDNNRQKNQSAEIIVEDFESESAMASTQDQREEELQTFWSYIVGMLMNLDTLPLERIHQMLKMFAFQGPTIECNIQELKVFLDRKVREHQLIFSGGLYKLPKP